MDGVQRSDDENDAEGLELDGEIAVVGRGALEVEGGGEGDGEACGDTFDGTLDGGSLVSVEFFLSSKLQGGGR